jgi:hypothetical protein
VRNIALIAAITFMLSGTGASAQEARPIRFWVVVTDTSRKALPGHLQPSRRFTPPTLTTHTLPERGDKETPGVVPTPLDGWICTVEPVFQGMIPATPAAPASVFDGVSIPASPARPAYVFQITTVACSSVSGQVTVSASCNLTSESVNNSGELHMSDAKGHSMDLTLVCSNG